MRLPPALSWPGPGIFAAANPRREHRSIRAFSRLMESVGDSQVGGFVIQDAGWSWRPAEMPRPLSEDLRERLVRAVSSGSSRNAAAKKFEVSVSAVIQLVHPPRTRQVRFPRAFGADWLGDGIDLQYQLGDFLPICSFLFGIQQAQIGHGVLFIIAGQDEISWRRVGNGRIERWSLH
jgi:hypothetical protein